MSVVVPYIGGNNGGNEHEIIFLTSDHFQYAENSNIKAHCSGGNLVVCGGISYLHLELGLDEEYELWLNNHYVIPLIKVKNTLDGKLRPYGVRNTAIGYANFVNYNAEQVQAVWYQGDTIAFLTWGYSDKHFTISTSVSNEIQIDMMFMNRYEG